MATNWKPKRGDIQMWLVCAAIGKDRNLIDKMEKDEAGNYPVLFSVGGVELDFNNVAKNLEKSLNELVANRAQELLDEKYEELIEELSDMQERIKELKSNFKYHWE